jgi:hypothetical protein
MDAARSNTDLDRSKWAATNAAPSSPSVEELVAFERMLADLSARMANVPSDRIEPEIQLAQIVLRQFLGFDRSTFAEFQDDSSLVVVSSTAIEGVDPTQLGPLPPQLDWFIAKLHAGETLVIQDPADDLPPEAVGEAEYIQRTGLRSHLIVGGRVVGAIAFSAFRETRNWPDDLIARVMLVGEVFAHAIARKREHEKLLAAMAEIRLLKDRLERENSYLKQTSQVRPLQRLRSRSPRFLSVVEEIKQVALTSSTVLLLGETGSGKEVLAQAIHDSSAQKDRAMIKGFPMMRLYTILQISDHFVQSASTSIWRCNKGDRDFQPEEPFMRTFLILAFSVTIFSATITINTDANAVVCAAGVVRAGCAGPNGAVVVRRPVAVVRPVVVAPAAGCRIVNGVRVCR